MSEIVPRWEWRAFAADFGQAPALLRAAGEPRVRESAETYILSKNSADNTKIRFELMDIKTLRQVDDHGLEQWFPLMKAGFPIEAQALSTTLRSWKTGGLSADAPVSYADFMAYVDAHPDLVSVAVTKRRSGWILDQAFVELGDHLHRIEGHLRVTAD